jgi:hypothetical protein
MNVAIGLNQGRHPLLLLSMLTLTAAGCGLNDYEARMTAIQQRIQQRDEENKLLADPIDVPTRTEGKKKVEVGSLFFRPPMGIPSSCSPSDPRGGLLYRFPSTASPPGAGSDAPGAVALVEVAFAPLKVKLGEDVLRLFPNADPKTAWSKHTLPGDEGGQTFQTAEFSDDNYFYSINICAGNASQVAVVFWVVKGSEQNVRKTLDLSLKTLALDADAATRQIAAQKPPWKLQRRPQ